MPLAANKASRCEVLSTVHIPGSSAMFVDVEIPFLETMTETVLTEKFESQNPQHSLFHPDAWLM